MLLEEIANRAGPRRWLAFPEGKYLNSSSSEGDWMVLAVQYLERARVVGGAWTCSESLITSPRTTPP